MGSDTNPQVHYQASTSGVFVPSGLKPAWAKNPSKGNPTISRTTNLKKQSQGLDGSQSSLSNKFEVLSQDEQVPFEELLVKPHMISMALAAPKKEPYLVQTIEFHPLKEGVLAPRKL
jgi:hypothetical protein